MTPSEMALAADWAAAEGWNPGLADAPCFATVDPQGFLIGELDGAPAATISNVNYSGDFAFLGFYIVRPDLRGRGYGLAIWRAAIAHAGKRIIGLDGVIAQQDNYRKSGFAFAYRNIRFGGTLAEAHRRRPGWCRWPISRSPRSKPTMPRCFRRRGRRSGVPGSPRPAIAGARCCATARLRLGA